MNTKTLTPMPAWPRRMSSGSKRRAGEVNSLRRLVGQALIGALWVCGRAWGTAAEPVLVAPNVVIISPQLTTSGQPSAAALQSLGAQGYGADIYLAPLTVPDAVPDEATIVTRQGLAFINIPIRFNQPAAEDFEAFVAAMAKLRDHKVLVHCQVNLRASSMVFLYRVIINHEDADLAYAAVAKVWSPDGPWRRFIVATLRQHGLAFEPY